MRRSVLAVAAGLLAVLMIGAALPAHAEEWPIIEVLRASDAIKASSSLFEVYPDSCGGVIVTDSGGIHALYSLQPTPAMEKLLESGVVKAKKMDLSITEYFLRIADPKTASYVYDVAGAGKGVMVVILKPGAPESVIEKVKQYAAETARTYGKAGVYIIINDIGKAGIMTGEVKPYEAGDLLLSAFQKTGIKAIAMDTEPLHGYLGLVQVNIALDPSQPTAEAVNTIVDALSHRTTCTPVIVSIAKTSASPSLAEKHSEPAPASAEHSETESKPSATLGLTLAGLGAALAVFGLVTRY